MKNKISFCIACKNRSLQKVYWDGMFRNEYFDDIPKGEYTLHLLPNCLQTVHDSQIEGVNFEVLISDFSSQDTKYEDWIDTTLKSIPYKIIEMGGVFNKGKGLNSAANASTGDILFFLDTDMLISKKLIKQCLNILSKNKAFFPICKSYKDPYHNNSWIRDSGYGNLIIWKDVFSSYGPWLEREVYGWEDDEMWYRLREIAHREIGKDFYHQWHPISGKINSFGGVFSKQNYRYELDNTKNAAVFQELNAKSIDNPLVSVIIYCNNNDPSLYQVISNVKNQSYKNYEIIILSNVNTRNKKKITSKYPDVSLVTPPTMNLANAFNFGIKIAQGDYYVFLKSTDVLLPHALETNMKYFATYPECALVAGKYIRIDDNNKIIDAGFEPIRKNQYLTLLIHNHIGPLSSVMFKREIFDLIGLFDEQLRSLTDYDIYLRIVKDYAIFHHEDEIVECKICFLDEAVDLKKDVYEIYRVYEKHKINTTGKNIRGFLKYIKKKNKIAHTIITNNKSYSWYEDDVRKAIKKGIKYYINKYAILEIMRIQREYNTSVSIIRMVKMILFLMRHSPAALANILATKVR